MRESRDFDLPVIDTNQPVDGVTFRQEDGGAILVQTAGIKDVQLLQRMLTRHLSNITTNDNLKAVGKA